MNDPFALLGVDEDADDEAVRKAYLRQVRAYPPEQEPVRFQEIRAAYETIATMRERLGARLFLACKPDMACLLAPLLKDGQSVRPHETTLLAVLAESVRAFRFSSVQVATTVPQNNPQEK